MTFSPLHLRQVALTKSIWKIKRLSLWLQIWDFSGSSQVIGWLMVYITVFRSKSFRMLRDSDTFEPWVCNLLVVNLTKQSETLIEWNLPHSPSESSLDTSMNWLVWIQNGFPSLALISPHDEAFLSSWGDEPVSRVWDLPHWVLIHKLVQPFLYFCSHPSPYVHNGYRAHHFDSH